MARKRAKTWSYSAGEHGKNRVRVYERSPGSNLFAVVNLPDRVKRVSLGHKDRERAEKYARDQAHQIEVGTSTLTEQRAPLGIILGAFLEEVLPDRKNEAQRKRDLQRAELWTRYLGRDFDPTRFTPKHWTRFIRDRSSGAIDSRGRAVPAARRKPAGPRTVGADLTWLRGALNWACAWITDDGEALLAYNPTNTDKRRVYRIPRVKNPRTPRAMPEQLEAIREFASETRCSGNRPTYLPELLDIIYGTGRRATAVCSLQYSEFNRNRTKTAPYGQIRWKGETDKLGVEWGAPINADVRAAIDRVLADRPGVGDGWLFPHPSDPTKPITHYMARDWLKRAAKLAGLELPKGWGWHSFRRTWVTERKGIPVKDVAAAGGWKSPAMVIHYQKVDEVSTLAAVLNEPLKTAEMR